MGAGRAWIKKGPILAQLDRLSRQDGDDGELRRALAELRLAKERSIVDIGVKYGCVRGPEQARHVENWFNPAKGWWADLQPIEPIVRRALIKAGELVRRHRCPADCYWIRSPGNRFEVAVCRSEAQISVFFLTPEPPARADARCDVYEPISVVRRAPPGSGEALEREVSGVHTVRLKTRSEDDA